MGDVLSIFPDGRIECCNLGRRKTSLTGGIQFCRNFRVHGPGNLEVRSRMAVNPGYLLSKELKLAVHRRTIVTCSTIV